MTETPSVAPASTPPNPDCEWDKVAKDGDKQQEDPSPAEFLASHGISASDAARIVDVAGCETADDLKLLRGDAVREDLARRAGLKIVPAEKLRRALASLSDEVEEDGDAGTVAEEKNTDESVVPADLEGGDDKSPEKPVDEVVVICIDRSFSMGTPLDEATLNFVPGAINERSRLEAVKVMFYGFRDRVEQLSRRHKLGLIQFDNEVDVLLGPPTDDLDLFETIVDDMERRGSTAIFSAIVAACDDQLAPCVKGSAAAATTDVGLRVLVLSDGESNCGASAQRALDAAHEIGAVVDAIIVGDRADTDLRRVVAATGGEAFQIKSLGEGFELLEAESTVSLRARRGGGDTDRPKERGPKPMLSVVPAKSLAVAASTVVSATTMRPLRVVDVGVAGNIAPLLGRISTADGTSTGTKRRITKELTALSTEEGVHLFPSESNLLEWRALIEGPAESPFEGGTFVLDVRIPADYPFKPPSIHFATPVYHCNVSNSGGICLDVLRDGWSPLLSIPRAIEAIRRMLAEPNADDAIRAQIAEQTLAYRRSNGRDARYLHEAQRRTKADASKTVDEWRRDWVGQGTPL